MKEDSLHAVKDFERICITRDHVNPSRFFFGVVGRGMFYNAQSRFNDSAMNSFMPKQSDSSWLAR